jgi:hypothetical protein
MNLINGHFDGDVLWRALPLRIEVIASLVVSVQGGGDRAGI